MSLQEELAKPEYAELATEMWLRSREIHESHVRGEYRLGYTVWVTGAHTERPELRCHMGGAEVLVCYHPSVREVELLLALKKGLFCGDD